MYFSDNFMVIVWLYVQDCEEGLLFNFEICVNSIHIKTNLLMIKYICRGVGTGTAGKAFAGPIFQRASHRA